MNKSIDLTYKEVSDNQEGESLFGVSTQTVKKCISRLEKTYFQGRNVFRNGDIKSDYLFRYEIKGLLLLLIELECNDVFRNERTKKEGISHKNREKIIECYEKVYGSEYLRDYEQRILMQTFNGEDSIKFLDTIKRFQDALTNFMLLTVKHYNQVASDLFIDIIDQLETWSIRIVRHFEKLNEICQAEENLCHIQVNPKTGIGYIEETGNLQLDLKNAVVRAINLFSDKFYYFDEAGKCSRKALADQIEKLDLEDDKDLYVKEAKQLFEQYAYSEDGGKTFAKHHFVDNENVDIELIQQSLEMYLDRVFKALIPNQSLISSCCSTEGNLSLTKTELEKRTKEYLQSYLSVRFIPYDIFEPVACPYCFDRYDQLRERIYEVSLNGEIYKDHLRSLEAKIWKYMCPDKQDNRMYIDLLEPRNWSNEMNDMIAETIDEFFRCANRNKTAFDRETYENIEQMLTGTKYSYIGENAKEIYDICKNLIGNMLAMILKIEAKKTSGSK